MERSEYDYVIVGAGSAGCVLAARLSADPDVTVALVEAGGPDDDPAVRVPFAAVELFGSESDWAFTTAPQPRLDGRAVDWPRGRTLGGSSAINFQMWVPGHDADYDDWAAAAGEGWSAPVVRAAMRRAERWAGEPGEGATYGTAGPLWISPPRDPDATTADFLRACAELGLPPVRGGLAGPGGTGCALTPLNQYGGERWSAADGYLRPAMDRPNLDVRTRTAVRRVVLEDGPGGPRASAVETADGERVAARREVVLSAGAVASPQLLLLSGIGDPSGLREAGVGVRSALPGVGRNLQDHVILDLPVRATAPTGLAGAAGDAARELYESSRRGPLTSNIAEAVAFLRSDGGPGAPDLELIWTPVAFTEEGIGEEPGVTAGVVLLRPESTGRVTLAGPDPSAPPVIDPGYLTAAADLPRLVAGVRFVERLLDTAALRPLVAGPFGQWKPGLSDADLGAYAGGGLQTLFHPVGTCRMGRAASAGADGSVVDERLRVHGVRGLRVADASVIPRVPRGHTHAHAVAVGERAAELITEDARG
ncbi:GMC family oxidoreductase N-terminal domain-containing protein [Streptomyces sp. TRM 70351]|uniref:GMC family oxidoreductase n=1 Tax=Streptomyces sp. TRM 70351 TaxID=3116552 RepID=UPI002E7B8E0B|nr:GMC family oxidoreductase N-terminal domain-containing protein [Streptomyces sp. TRM 70351]MEE1929759.1 GMC family oxidoreductase N-terminal domain-containing protein [Streptomyces sp. TRM 70351]